MSSKSMKAMEKMKYWMLFKKAIPVEGNQLKSVKQGVE